MVSRISQKVLLMMVVICIISFFWLPRTYAVGEIGETGTGMIQNQPGNWVRDPYTGNWMYRFGNGTYATNQWACINGAWYHFDSNGYMQTGWLYVSGNTYYLDSSGARVSGWKQISGDWYYFNSAGVMQTGWIQYGTNNAWYYLGTNGIMRTGWIQYGTNDAWYYLDENGVMQTGWLTYLGDQYYLNPTGEMVTGWKQLGGLWYYFNSSGVMQTGWKQISNKWYYLNSSGVMQTGWIWVSGSRYYLDPASGTMCTGWIGVEGNQYYLDPASGAMQTGWKVINGTTYYLNPASGIMATGLTTVSGAQYYFDTEDGHMYTECWEKIGSIWYYLGTTGAVMTDSDVEGSANGKNTFHDRINQTVQYNNGHIEYFISNELSSYVSDIIEGVESWNAGSDFIYLTRTTSNNEADQHIKFVFENTNLYLGMTEHYIGTIPIDPTNEANENDWERCRIHLSILLLSNYDVAPTVAHEVGHALGLSHHITNTYSIMYRGTEGWAVDSPQAIDFDVVTYLYQ